NAVMVSEEMVRILEADAKKAKVAASYVLWDLSSFQYLKCSWMSPSPVGSPVVYEVPWISDIKRRTDTTGLGEEDMLCIMSGTDEDADGSGVM
ncbi:hypothetical protein B296_00057760, partial [Ensete ventricosum]